MPARVTIGVPTCGRPRAVEACLQSIAKHVSMEHCVLVVDSLVTDANRRMYAAYPTVTCIGRETPVGPSEARRLIAAEANTEYVLFLDDDNLVTPGSVEALMRHLDEHPEVGIAAGAWNEEGDGKRRALGQFFHFGRSDRGEIVFKEYMGLARATLLGLTACRVDGAQATLMIRRALFDRVSFDPQYDFFYELFDFFMQCREQAVRIEALPDVVFDHRPVPYETATLRQTGDRQDDRRRFATKWGVEPWDGTLPSARARRARSGSPGLLGRIARRMRRGRSPGAARSGERPDA